MIIYAKHLACELAFLSHAVTRNDSPTSSVGHGEIIPLPGRVEVLMSNQTTSKRCCGSAKMKCSLSPAPGQACTGNCHNKDPWGPTKQSCKGRVVSPISG